MSILAVLLITQIALGGLDNLWHHELKERLPGRREARVELALHSARELCYALMFAGLAWWEWHGAWTVAVIALLAAEVCATLADFIVEDRTRPLPKLERVLHTVLAMNFGALLAVLAPTLLAWTRLPTAITRVDHGVASWLLTAAAAGVLAWSVRNALAALRHFAAPTWQRVGLRPRRSVEPKTVLVTGATGFIGRKLVYRLVGRGDGVIVHARNAAKAADLFGPHVDLVTDLASVPADTRIDAIVNLAGEPIAGAPWTRRRRALLLESRIGVTEALLALVGRLAVKPTTWINASAIGYYGARDGDESLNEKSGAGKGFQAELCRRWEETASRAAEHGVKVALLRLGVVLGGDGGALPALARPVRMFAGVVLGTGRQWFSWIHIDDLLDLISFVLAEGRLAGPLNATAPEPVRHEELMTTMAATLRRPLWPVRVPARILRTGLGELAELFVDGQRVTPDRLQALKFKFRYATIDAALEQALATSARSGHAHKRATS
ncbi:MAG TPA: TIGR01777 family oxidoreductase [Gammaproteobacteria bacterium]|nr:TIGR01777 family oxidoreductase [Gammaproteobacteria bacterium]